MLRAYNENKTTKIRFQAYLTKRVERKFNPTKISRYTIFPLFSICCTAAPSLDHAPCPAHSRHLGAGRAVRDRDSGVDISIRYSQLLFLVRHHFTLYSQLQRCVGGREGGEGEERKEGGLTLGVLFPCIQTELEMSYFTCHYVAE